MGRITENTWVPLSLVGTGIACIISGSVWLTTIYSTGMATAETVKGMMAKQELRDAEFSEIKATLARMEAKIDILTGRK